MKMIYNNTSDLLNSENWLWNKNFKAQDGYLTYVFNGNRKGYYHKLEVRLMYATTIKRLQFLNLKKHIYCNGCRQSLKFDPSFGALRCRC